MIHSLLLGLIQGLTEFLPVSSSGHLALAQNFLGWKEPVLAFDIALHCATMLATVVYFRKDVLELGGQWFSGLVNTESRGKPGWIVGWAMIAGTVLTVVLGLPLKPLVERLSTSVFAVGVALVFTGGLLWVASLLPRGTGRVTVLGGATIGLAQGLAVIPGISRSGSTIVAGLGLKLSSEEAFRFSFLLSLPAILGASILELADFTTSSMPSGWFLGVLVAGLSGYGALSLLRKVVTLGRWRGFSVYCVILGLVSVFLGR
ncbi:undecaprenyl-diphosphate phosphatase [Dethiosulfovibrio sp. F2B]|uniref:undecaprenyl-diphosphate phosphatase n=1 Tax=Dethiosulfovibrio faecalis TaxID=2720018 RepID=UPI001F21C0EC|nr:undecaprenyl-diphosphate phosphatase [Dethiosulfovibrio faecalis]MCF4150701.1 undecaprenyl-diphosphate phosphatase [Dethiosulfovibrio faecalis]